MKDQRNSRATLMTPHIVAAPLRRITRDRWDLVLTLVLVAIAGNPSLFYDADPAGGGQKVAYLVFMMVVVSLAILRDTPPTRTDIYVGVLFLAIIVIHLVQFGAVPIYTAEFGFIVKLVIAVCFVRVVANPWRKFADVMTFVAGVSLVFYSLQITLGLVGVDIYSALATWSLTPQPALHLGIHNFHIPEEWHRNSGMFWEPGALAGYVLLAMICVIAQKSRYARKQYIRRMAVLSITLVTTQSTTGYILMPIVLSLGLAASSRGKPHAMELRVIAVAISVAILAGFLTWLDLPFLRDKLEGQFESVSRTQTGWEITRFGTAIYDSRFIAERPLFGWSPHTAPREAIDPMITEIVKGQGNGLTGFTVQFGLTGIIAFLCFTFLAFNALFERQHFPAAVCVLIVAGMLNGEAFLGAPVFLALMFNPNGHRAASSVTRNRYAAWRKTAR